MGGTRESWLLMRSGGALWATSSAGVRGVARRAGRFHVRMPAHVLEVDEVLSLSRLDSVHDAGPVERSVMPPGCHALGLCQHGPVLLIDHRAPPAVLLADQGPSGPSGEESHGTET